MGGFFWPGDDFSEHTSLLHQMAGEKGTPEYSVQCLEGKDPKKDEL